MKRIRSHRGGSSAVVFALGAVPLLFVATVTLDLVGMINQRNDLQSALDAAVLNGARAMHLQDQRWRDRADGTFVGNMPAAKDAVRTFTAKGPEVHGEARYRMPTWFSGLIGKKESELVVTAAATMVSPQAGGCILVTESVSRGVLMNSGGQINSNCGLQVNSTSSEALFVNSGARVRTPATKVVGKVRANNGADIDKPAEENAPVIQDPLKTLAQPSVGAPGPNVIVDAGTTRTLAPGTHGVVNINSNGRLILSPGVHVFTTHFNIGSNATLEGDGVTLFFANGGGKFQVNANATTKLKAPTNGVYRGVLFFQGRGNTEQFIINTNASLEWFGVIYIPDGELLINSHANVAALKSDIAVITNTLIVNSGSRLNIERTMGACGASPYLPSAVSALCAVGGGAGGQTGLRLIR